MLTLEKKQEKKLNHGPKKLARVIREFADQLESMPAPEETDLRPWQVSITKQNPKDAELGILFTARFRTKE